MPLYPVGDNKFVEIDEIDIVAISFHGWHFDKDSRNKYIRAKINNKMVYLHKFIAKRMGLNVAETIDHEDRNIFNCKRTNLREATKSQQNANTKIYKNNSTRLKGVTFKRSINKYVARIMINHQSKHLGYFDNPYEAKEAYDKAAVKYFEEFACLG